MEQQKNSSFKTLTEKLKEYVDGDANTFFEYFMLFAILVNTVSIGLASTALGMQNPQIYFIIDQICLALFIIELILKLFAYNKDFFSASGWNTFDLIIVLLSVFSSFSYFQIFKVFKIFRTLKYVKLLKSLKSVKALKVIANLKQLQKIISALVHSIPSIIWTFLLLLVFFYVYAILGVNMFSNEFPEYFGSLSATFYTLFELMIFDKFGDISRPVISAHPTSWVYFVSFALISAFIVLQVVTGIIVDSMQTSITQPAEEKKNEAEE